MAHHFSARPKRTRHHEADPAWWKAPLVASVPTIPLIAWQYALYHRDGYGQSPIMMSLALLVIAWLLPHYRSLRGIRTALSVISAVVAVLPIGCAILLGLAMASGAP